MSKNKNAKTPADGPVAWMHTTAAGLVYFRKKPHDKVFSPQAVYTAEQVAAAIAAEREACAKVCENKNTLLEWPTYAAAIRARGKQ
jgi:hypothetical protein